MLLMRFLINKKFNYEKHLDAYWTTPFLNIMIMTYQMIFFSLNIKKATY